MDLRVPTKWVHSSPLTGFAAVAFALLSPALTGAAPPIAPDTVTLKREGSSGRIIVRGTIREYTGRTLELFPAAGGGIQSFPASEVVQIDFPRSDAHRRGIEELDAARIESAAKLFEQALLDEKRSWVRREILALSIRCALFQGDRGAAGSKFLALLQSDADTRFFEMIPLEWRVAANAGSSAAQAKSWLSHGTEAGRLLGASILLDDPQSGAAAERELHQLATSSDPRILHLARAQQWRQSLKVPSLPREEIERWQSRIDEMPDRLRGGPMFLVGHGYLARGEKHRAAAAFLWLPMVYDRDAGLAADASVQAASALADIGQKHDAALLYREASERFHGTSAAEVAAEKFQALQKEQGDTTKSSTPGTSPSP